MHGRSIVILAAVVTTGTVAAGQGQRRLNPMIELMSQNKPVFGLYAPSNPRARSGASVSRPGGIASTPPFTPPPVSSAPPPSPPKTPAQLAQDALANTTTDFIFDGTMEGDIDRALPAYTEFVKGMAAKGSFHKSPARQLTHPLVVKMHEIAPDTKKAADSISKQLNLGVSGIMFVKVESAAEAKAGIAAMRFKSKGGTRPDEVGDAPKLWGMSTKDYREKADLWPLNPNGELVNWTIIESKEGLANIREIAAVPGIGVLWPGAGTLRGIFSTTAPDGTRKLDEAAWEAAIQQVLSACKEFKIACGYPASPADIEMRMKQGFNVFVMNWGDQGFRAIEIGRKASGR